MKNTSILGIGAYSPARVVDNDFLSKFVDTSDEWITDRTGIKSRKLSEGEDTSQMAVEAAKIALSNAGISAEDLGLIIVSTVTPDNFTPSTACLVQKEIGADNAVCFDITAACSGFVYGLDVADKYMRLSEVQYALVIGAETLSKVVDWTDRNTCVLFSDGAGAAVLSAGEEKGILASYLGSQGDKKNSLVIPALPVKNIIADTPKDKPVISMNGREVFKFAVNTLPKCVEKVLEQGGMTLEDIDYIVPHQANYRIISAVAERMGISEDKFFMNLDTYGNTSSASIPLALYDMKKNGMLKKGMKLIFVGFGGGLTWGSTLVELVHEI